MNKDFRGNYTPTTPEEKRAYQEGKFFGMFTVVILGLMACAFIGGAILYFFVF